MINHYSIEMVLLIDGIVHHISTGASGDSPESAVANAVAYIASREPVTFSFFAAAALGNDEAQSRANRKKAERYYTMCATAKKRKGN